MFLVLVFIVFICVWLVDGDGMSLGHRTHQSTVNQLRTLAECDTRAMESAARAMQEVMVKRIEEASSRVAAAAAAASANSQAKLTTTSSVPMKVEDVAASTKRSRSTAAEDQVPSNSNSNSSGGGSSFVQPGPAPPQPPPPAHLLLAGRSAGVGAAHIKLTSRSEFEFIYCVCSLYSSSLCSSVIKQQCIGWSLCCKDRKVIEDESVSHRLSGTPTVWPTYWLIERNIPAARAMAHFSLLVYLYFWIIL